jgi:hypothetical protein
MKTKLYIINSLSEFKRRKNIKILIDSVIQYFKWRKSMENETPQSINDFHPWMNFNVVSFLERELDETMTVFEYGSGSSTIFLSKKVKNIISVEHDLDWYLNIKNLLGSYKINNVDYKHLPPQSIKGKLNNLDFKNPESYYSEDENYKTSIFENYSKAICDYPDNYFDLVIVDGRARSSCILHSIGKVKVGGYLLVDNTEREYYLEPFKQRGTFKNWTLKEFTGHVPGLAFYSSTTLLKKNK